MAVGWGIKVRHITSKGLRYRWYRWLGKNGCGVGGLFSTPWPCTCPILDWTRTHNQDQSHGIPQRIIQIEIVTSVDEPATGARCIAACSGIQPYSRKAKMWWGHAHLDRCAVIQLSSAQKSAPQDWPIAKLYQDMKGSNDPGLACTPKCGPQISGRNSKFEMWQKEVWIQKFTKRHYNAVVPESKLGQCPGVFAYFFLGTLKRRRFTEG